MYTNTNVLFMILTTYILSFVRNIPKILIILLKWNILNYILVKLCIFRA